MSEDQRRRWGRAGAGRGARRLHAVREGPRADRRVGDRAAGTEAPAPVARAEEPGPPPTGGPPRRGGRRGDKNAVVPDATFTSYYGRPVLKASPWTHDIPSYLFLGGLAAGSSLLGAGADLNDRPGLRRTSHLGATAAILISFGALVHDLGRPSRFYNMLRVVKPTSPMSVGTWILTAYGPLAGLAGAAELRGLLPPRLARAERLLGFTARPAGLGAALLGPAVASYTAVLLSDTATPTWHDAHRQLPFVFVGSAASAAGGLGMLGSDVQDAASARRLAVGGALLELAAGQQMERTMGLTAEPLRNGTAGSLMRISRALTVAGTAGTLLFGRRSRLAAATCGAALLTGSACLRFGVFQAGQESARDPRYIVVPQRERVDRQTEGARSKTIATEASSTQP